MYGKEINLQHISNGHYCIPLTPKQLAVTDIQQNGSRPVKVLFTVDDLQNKSPQEKAAMASKLHKQFGHPVNSERLKQLLRDANIQDDDLFKQIDTVTESCDICGRYKKARSRPVVSLPLADDFNQCLAMDLKFITINKRSFIILHMIDVFTHFSQAVTISSKHKETTANAILKHWVSIFGVSQSILSDNGGEFDNNLLLDLAELLGTKTLTTAALIHHGQMGLLRGTMLSLKI